MRISLLSLIKMTSLAALIASACAVGVSRMSPPPPRSWRMPCPVGSVAFNNCFLGEGKGCTWFDLDDGRPGTFATPPEESLDYASRAPWRDDRGRSQVVGRWMRPLDGSAGEADFGLARVSFPDGEVLDRVSLNVVPLGSPCWYPESRARVLFAGGDGVLYEQAFEPPVGSPREIEWEPGKPRAIGWRAEIPGGAGAFASDPHWSADPEFARVVLVGLRFTEDRGGASRYNSSQIWSLRLSLDGSTIEEAGRVFDPEPGDYGRPEERCPSIGRLDDGRLALAYLRKADGPNWSLRVVPVEFDRKLGRPRASRAASETLSTLCRLCVPSFSPDGRRILAVEAGPGLDGSVRVFDLAGRPVAPTGPDARSLARAR